MALSDAQQQEISQQLSGRLRHAGTGNGAAGLGGEEGGVAAGGGQVYQVQERPPQDPRRHQ